MKSIFNSDRRSFLKAGAFIAGSAFTQSGVIASPNILHDLYKPKSKIKGVQIGCITYSFRDMPDQSAEATLQYVLDSGISAIELMGDPAETFAGRPKNPVDFKAMFPLMRKQREKIDLTDEEKKQLDEMQATTKAYREEVKNWRMSAPMNKFTQLGKMYKKAGVKIYAFKPDAFGLQNSDAEIEYGMQAAKNLGANQVTVEHPGNDAHTLKLSGFAQKYGLRVGYHGHEQQKTALWDTALGQSSANAMNLDLGHYIAAGNTDALDLIRKRHDRISS
ncbi:MAG: sugar phosphate isomerase/epimerase, partial [Saprospiraceae bacterium]